VQIIVKSLKGEKERQMKDAAAQTLKAYYKREIRDGARFRSRFTKSQIRKVYESGQA
jgi:hypothetical protein